MSNQLLRYASGWTPAAFGSNLRLWLRSDSNVTTSGASITAWGDKSTFANTTAQTTAADQPQLVTDSTLQNKSIVQFGNGDNLSGSATVSLQPLTNNWTVFFLIKLDAGASSGDYPNIIGSRPWNAAADKGWNISQQLSVSSQLGTHFATGLAGFDVTSPGSVTALSTTTWQFWQIDVRRGATTYVDYYLNNVLDASRTFLVPDPAASIDNTSDLRIGRDLAAGNRKFGGRLPEVGCINKTPSVSERSSLWQYMKGRYGL